MAGKGCVNVYFSGTVKFGNELKKEGAWSTILILKIENVVVFKSGRVPIILI